MWPVARAREQLTGYTADLGTASGCPAGDRPLAPLPYGVTDVMVEDPASHRTLYAPVATGRVPRPPPMPWTPSITHQPLRAWWPTLRPGGRWPTTSPRGRSRRTAHRRHDRPQQPGGVGAAGADQQPGPLGPTARSTNVRCTGLELSLYPPTAPGSPRSKGCGRHRWRTEWYTIARWRSTASTRSYPLTQAQGCERQLLRRPIGQLAGQTDVWNRRWPPTWWFRERGLGYQGQPAGPSDLLIWLTMAGQLG
jgi:hypothetical protein